MKRADLVRCWFAAALFVIVVLALARIGVAQDETQTPREAVEEKQPDKAPTFTISPVPNYGGDFGGALISQGIGAGSGRSWQIAACNSILTSRRFFRVSPAAAPTEREDTARPNRHGAEAGLSKAGALAAWVSVCGSPGTLWQYGQLVLTEAFFRSI